MIVSRAYYVQNGIEQTKRRWLSSQPRNFLWCYVFICCHNKIKTAKIFAIQASQRPWAPILKPIHLSNSDTKFGHHTYSTRDIMDVASRLCPPSGYQRIKYSAESLTILLTQGFAYWVHARNTNILLHGSLLTRIHSQRANVSRQIYPIRSRKHSQTVGMKIYGKKWKFDSF